MFKNIEKIIMNVNLLSKICKDGLVGSIFIIFNYLLYSFGKSIQESFSIGCYVIYLFVFLSVAVTVGHLLRKFVIGLLQILKN